MKVSIAHTGSMWRDSSPTYMASTLAFTPSHQTNTNAIQFKFRTEFHFIPSSVLIKEGEKFKIQHYTH